jgi:hypothetical protein
MCSDISHRESANKKSRTQTKRSYAVSPGKKIFRGISFLVIAYIATAIIMRLLVDYNPHFSLKIIGLIFSFALLLYGIYSFLSGIVAWIKRAPGTSKEHRNQNRLKGYTLVSTGLFVATTGMLRVFIVFPLGEEDSASFIYQLPVFIQVLIYQIPDGTPLILLMLPGMLILFIGYVIIKFGRRHLVVSYPASEFDNTTDTLLYLRPFVTDKLSIPYTGTLDWIILGAFDTRLWTVMWLFLHGINRYEELLAYAFRHIGKFVTIGNPKEQLPQLGALRLYSSTTEDKGGDSWKNTVSQLIADSKLICLHVGFSDSIRWEIEAVIASADPQSVLLCVNAPRPKAKLRGLQKVIRAEIGSAWNQFREAYGPIFPHGLPKTLGKGRFVRFNEDWGAEPVQPTKRKVAWFIPVRSSRNRPNKVESALAWLSWILVPEPFGRRFARKFINFLTFIVSLFGIIAFLVLLVSFLR